MSVSHFSVPKYLRHSPHEAFLSNIGIDGVRKRGRGAGGAVTSPWSLSKFVPVTQAQPGAGREGGQIKGMRDGTDICHATFNFFSLSCYWLEFLIREPVKGTS